MRASYWSPVTVTGPGIAQGAWDETGPGRFLARPRGLLREAGQFVRPMGGLEAAPAGAAEGNASALAAGTSSAVKVMWRPSSAVASDPAQRKPAA